MAGERHDRVPGKLPVALSIVAGFAAPHRSGRAFAPLLLVLGLILLVAWPSEPVLRALLDETAPITLRVVAIALGVSMAYLQLQAGAEELLEQDRHSLLEWALATSLPIRRLMSCYVLGSLVQGCLLVGLGLPMVFLAQSLTGWDWQSLAAIGAVLITYSVAHRLLAAIVYLFLGHLGPATFLAVRGIALAWYLLTLAYMPSLSQAKVLRGLTPVEAQAIARSLTEDVAGFARFVFSYSLLLVLLTLALAGVLWWQRARALRAAAG